MATSRARSIAPWAALFVVLAVALGVAVSRSRPDTSPAARAARIAKQVNCPDCQGELLANSQSSGARTLKAKIRELIAEGKSDDEIYAFIERSYPGSNLVPGRGIGLVAWLVPVLAIIAALGGLFLALRKWSRQPRLTATDDDERIVQQARATADPPV
jgi:cytochrome c-type biogenesis protein CcmH